MKRKCYALVAPQSAAGKVTINYLGEFKDFADADYHAPKKTLIILEKEEMITLMGDIKFITDLH